MNAFETSGIDASIVTRSGTTWPGSASEIGVSTEPSAPSGSSSAVNLWLVSRTRSPTSVANPASGSGVNDVGTRVASIETGTPCMGAPKRYLPRAVKRATSPCMYSLRSAVVSTLKSTVRNSSIMKYATAGQSPPPRHPRRNVEAPGAAAGPMRARTYPVPRCTVGGRGIAHENAPNESSVTVSVKRTRSRSSTPSTVALLPASVTSPCGLGARK